MSVRHRLARTPAARLVANGHLAERSVLRDASPVEPVVYREEVLTIMGVLGDIRLELVEIHDLLVGDGGEEEEEENS